MAAPYDVNLRNVPSDAASNDVRLYEPGVADAPPPPGGETPPLRTMMGMGR